LGVKEEGEMERPLRWCVHIERELGDIDLFYLRISPLKLLSKFQTPKKKIYRETHLPM